MPNPSLASFLRPIAVCVAALCATLAIAGSPVATDTTEEWSSWRGPSQNGVSPATGLLSEWTVDGPGQLWRAELVGRSTPVVFDGRVCANGRDGDGVEMRETVACWDAASGELLWQRFYSVYNTTVPFARVGWGSIAGDPETGNVYVLNIDGHFSALDAHGNTVWEMRLYEDYGRASGYGGRTSTPVIDEDRVILGIIANSWGPFGPPRHRFYAFDKHDGSVVWTSDPTTENVKDRNTQAVPIITEIDGQRLMIAGAADGWIYALQARTGAFVWRFQLSKRGINVSAVEQDGIVYAAHSEENLDEGVLGRVVAIDARGTGDITRTNEIWRANEVAIGFGSPLLHGGTLYVIDNSANLFAFDAATGAQRWKQNIGNVGKSSPVWADGKIYATEVNGNFIILRPGPNGAEILDNERIEMPDGRHAEIYGSPAIAYGRIFFTTEAGLFAIGDGTVPVVPARAKALTRPIAPVGVDPAALTVVPADVNTDPGQEIDFEVRAFDAAGNLIGTRQAEWSLQGLTGELDEDGRFVADPSAGSQAGHVVATIGELTARARVRVTGSLPYSEDFTSGQRPGYWIGAGRFNTAELEGEPVLQKPPSPSGIHRHVAFTGRDSTTGVTVQVDLYGTQQGRRRPDGGVVNGGYTLDLAGNHQRLEIRAWASELRMMQRTPFAWDMNTWYTVKLRVDLEAKRGVIRAKVWPRDTPEPAEWTLEAVDPLPIRHGAPGVYGYSPVDIYYDNYKVTVNE